MTRKIRRILFGSAVVVFLISSYISLLYAQGYKYDFTDQKFSRTGAISVKVNTEAAVIVENGKPRKTSFLGNAASVDRLLPGSYTVRVEKEGYYPWRKTAVIQGGLVTDFPRIMLLSQKDEDLPSLQEEIKEILYPAVSPSPSISPALSLKSKSSLSPIPTPLQTPVEPIYIQNQNLYLSNKSDSTLLGKNVEGFLMSPDEKKIIWWTDREIWSLWLNDSNYQPYHKSGDKELIIRFRGEIKKAGWFRDSDHIVVDSTSRYHVLEIDTRGGVNIVKI